jgi:hypothetical protein
MHHLNAAEYVQLGFLVGLSLLVSLVTLVWCALLIPRLKFTPDRLLVALVGLLCFLHIFKLVQETGIWPIPIPATLRPVSGFLVALAFLAAVFLLGAYRAQHRSVEYRLRLAEANEAVPSAGRGRPQSILRSGLGV